MHPDLPNATTLWGYMDQASSPMAVALRDGTSFRDLDVYARRRDGGIGHGLVNIDAIRDENGKVIGAINVVQDITMLQETQEIFATIFQQAAMGMVLVNGDCSVRDVNPFFCRMLGYDRKEVVGRDFRDFGHPDDLEATATGFASSIQGGGSRSAERRYLRKDGQIVTGRITAARATDPFGRITIIVTIEDITQERAAQQALAKSQAYLKRLPI
jgi:PAS domain S-box-containing protein